MSSSPGPTTSLAFPSPTTATGASPATLITSTTAPATSTGPRLPHYPPLTTKWSTAPTCTWTFDIAQEPQPGTPGPIAWLDLEPDVDATTLSCYPDGMFYEGRTGTFSPATCPNGWTTVSVRQDDDMPETMAATTAVCCSSEYTLDGSFCKREQPTVLAVPIIYNTTAGTHDILTDQTSTLTSATLAVHAIKALFCESDKEMLGLTDDSAIREEPVERRGMSLGSRIGIGIGATIGGALAIGVVLWLLLRRRKSYSEKLCRRGHARPFDDHAPGGGENTVSADAPPPAYEFSVRSSVTDDESCAAGGHATAPSGEIEVLRAQRAAIERRIEELETVDTRSETRDPS